MFRKLYKLANWKLILAAVLMIVIIGGTYKHYHKSITPSTSVSKALDAQKKQINYSPPNPSDNASNNQRKGSSTPGQTLNTPSTPPPFSVTVTRVNVDSSNINVSAIAQGATSGTCTLSLSQTGQQTITRTESIVLQVNNYGCPTFSVATSSLPNNNEWNVAVSVTSAGNTATGQWPGNPVSLKG